MVRVGMAGRRERITGAKTSLDPPPVPESFHDANSPRNKIAALASHSLCRDKYVNVIPCIRPLHRPCRYRPLISLIRMPRSAFMITCTLIPPMLKRAPGFGFNVKDPTAWLYPSRYVSTKPRIAGVRFIEPV